MRIVAAGDFAKQYFHGTVTPNLEEITPGVSHGRRPTFPHDTDPNYAYATGDERWARHYAEMAHAAGDAGTIPRVYQVEPKDPSDVEEDPFYDSHGRSRSIFDTDVRSKSGWNVVKEMPWPEEWGDPEDWR